MIIIFENPMLYAYVHLRSEKVNERRFAAVSNTERLFAVLILVWVTAR